MHRVRAVRKRVSQRINRNYQQKHRERRGQKETYHRPAYLSPGNVHLLQFMYQGMSLRCNRDGTKIRTRPLGPLIIYESIEPTRIKDHGGD